MRKSMIWAAMLAMVLVLSIPALATGNNQNAVTLDSAGGGSGGDTVFDNDVQQEAESGDFAAETAISLSGDNSNQCAPVMQFGSPGNNQNAVTLNQYFSTIEDLELEDLGVISFAPEFENECAQAVQQAAAAG